MDSLRSLVQTSSSELCQAPMSFTASTWTIVVCCILGILWALLNYKLVIDIHIEDMQEI
jgi:hypothetical protein